MIKNKKLTIALSPLIWVMTKFKRFFKELKRVKWPTAKTSGKTFLISLIFIAVFALALFGFAYGLSSLWDKAGAGI